MKSIKATVGFYHGIKMRVPQKSTFRAEPQRAQSQHLNSKRYFLSFFARKYRVYEFVKDQLEKNFRNSGAVRITKTTLKKWKQTTSVALVWLSNASTIRALMAPGLVPR